MDPKGTSQLDPKLKEAYERVMGTNLSSSDMPPEPNPQQQPPPPPPSQQPQSQFGGINPPPPHSDTPPEFPAEVEASIPPPVHLDTSSTQQPPPVFQSYSLENSTPQEDGQTLQKQHSKFAVSTPILVVLGVAFFVAYALLWVMVFGIKLF